MVFMNEEQRSKLIRASLRIPRTRGEQPFWAKNLKHRRMILREVKTAAVFGDAVFGWRKEVRW